MVHVMRRHFPRNTVCNHTKIERYRCLCNVCKFKRRHCPSELCRHSKEWYTDVINIQTRIRIQLSIAAYIYEFDPEHKPFMSDSEFDQISKKVDLRIRTRRPDLDEFFIEHFDPNTGNWIRFHPELEHIKWLIKHNIK